MSTHSKIPSGLEARRDQTYQEDEHDPYKLRSKLKSTSVSAVRSKACTAPPEHSSYLERPFRALQH